MRTHLRSGNVVFGAKAGDEAKLEAALERALDTELDLPVRVVVRSAKALDAVIAANPFQDALDAPSNLHVGFLDHAADPAFVRAFDHEAIAPDTVRFAEREIYVWYRHGMAGSKLGDTAWRKAGATATDRNWNTVTRLAAMAAEA